MHKIKQQPGPGISDDDILSSPDRRAYGRQIAMLRLAKVQCSGREGWAFVRNLSASGMMLEVHSDFVMESKVTVILAENQHMQGNVRWRQDASAGIEFDHPIDIESMLKKASMRTDGQIARMPRVQMKHPVILRTSNRSVQADICDISPTGVCVQTDYVFEAGKRLKLVVREAFDIDGTVRWQAHGRTGIAFEERLSIHNLMTWLSTYYRSSESGDEQKSLPAGGALTLVAENDDTTMPKSYRIFGHDDLGRAMPITTLDSADAAIRYSRATSRYFERVSVTDGGGEEISMARLVQLAIDQQQAVDD